MIYNSWWRELKQSPPTIKRPKTGIAALQEIRLPLNSSTREQEFTIFCDKEGTAIQRNSNRNLSLHLLISCGQPSQHSQHLSPTSINILKSETKDELSRWWAWDYHKRNPASVQNFIPMPWPQIKTKQDAWNHSRGKKTPCISHCVLSWEREEKIHVGGEEDRITL